MSTLRLSPTQWHLAMAGKTATYIPLQEQIQWSLLYQPHFIELNSTTLTLEPEKGFENNTEMNSSLFADIQAQAQTVMTHAIEKGSELFSHYLEPMLTKTAIDKSLAQTVVMSTYFGTIGSIAAPSFAAKTTLAMGFKIFATATTPLVAQFVESVTETHLNHAKYTYHSIRCIFDEQACETLKTLPRPIANEDVLAFDNLDLNKAYQGASDNLSKLTPNGLLLSGIISAVASEIKDFSLEASQLKSYCEGYFCKNWIAYYYKEWLKQEIKHELPTMLTEDHMGSAKAITQPLTATVNAMPLLIHDVLDNHREAAPLHSCANNNLCAQMPFKPILEVCPAVVTMEVPL